MGADLSGVSLAPDSSNPIPRLNGLQQILLAIFEIVHLMFVGDFG